VFSALKVGMASACNNIDHYTINRMRPQQCFQRFDYEVGSVDYNNKQSLIKNKNF
jgi:hypothetical protein